jgi:hypothetical protein
MLTVQTTAALVKNAQSSRPWANPAAPLLAGICALFLLLPLRRVGKFGRSLLLAFVAVAALGAAAALTGCGGGFSAFQPSQSYTLTVTGTSGTDSHSTTVHLTVQ